MVLEIFRAASEFKDSVGVTRQEKRKRLLCEPTPARFVTTVAIGVWDYITRDIRHLIFES
jgi:hypothetical protein